MGLKTTFRDSSAGDSPAFSTAGGPAWMSFRETQITQKIDRKILGGMYLWVKIVSWAGRDQPCLWKRQRGGKRCRHDVKRTGRPSPVMSTRGCGSPPRRIARTPTRLSDARPTNDGPRTCGRPTSSSCDASGSWRHSGTTPAQHSVPRRYRAASGPGCHPPGGTATCGALRAVRDSRQAGSYRTASKFSLIAYPANPHGEEASTGGPTGRRSVIACSGSRGVRRQSAVSPRGDPPARRAANAL